MNQELAGDDVRAWLAEYGFDVDDVYRVMMVVRSGGLQLAVTTYKRGADGRPVVTPSGLWTVTHNIPVYNFPKWVDTNACCCEG